jgi:hypothetical protein
VTSVASGCKRLLSSSSNFELRRVNVGLMLAIRACAKRRKLKSAEALQPGKPESEESGKNLLLYRGAGIYCI